MKKSLLVLVLVVFLCCVFSLSACSKVEINPSPESFSWMSKLDDSLLLSEIAIPGTHDSGATRSGFIYNWGHNQDLGIADQLAIGARFFDIRLGVKKGKLEVYHSFLKQNVSFDSVVSDCKAFLEKNPNEVVLMCIKRERSDSITELVHDKIDKDSSLWYTQNAIPALGEVRGKIVLFRRFEDDKEFGVNLQDGFVDNDTFDVDNGVKCHVQDYYKYDNKASKSKEWDAIQNCLTYQKSNNEYVINFTSGYYQLISFIPIPRIKETAEYVHPRFLDYAKEHKENIKGIILFDLVTEELTKAVYQVNG